MVRTSAYAALNDRFLFDGISVEGRETFGQSNIWLGEYQSRIGLKDVRLYTNLHTPNGDFRPGFLADTHELTRFAKGGILAGDVREFGGLPREQWIGGISYPYVLSPRSRRTDLIRHQIADYLVSPQSTVAHSSRNIHIERYPHLPSHLGDRLLKVSHGIATPTWHSVPYEKRETGIAHFNLGKRRVLRDQVFMPISPSHTWHDRNWGVVFSVQGSDETIIVDIDQPVVSEGYLAVFPWHSNPTWTGLFCLRCEHCHVTINIREPIDLDIQTHGNVDFNVPMVHLNGTGNTVVVNVMNKVNPFRGGLDDTKTLSYSLIEGNDNTVVVAEYKLSNNQWAFMPEKKDNFFGTMSEDKHRYRPRLAEYSEMKKHASSEKNYHNSRTRYQWYSDYVMGSDQIWLSRNNWIPSHLNISSAGSLFNDLVSDRRIKRSAGHATAGMGEWA